MCISASMTRQGISCQDYEVFQPLVVKNSSSNVRMSKCKSTFVIPLEGKGLEPLRRIFCWGILCILHILGCPNFSNYIKDIKEPSFGECKTKATFGRKERREEKKETYIT